MMQEDVGTRSCLYFRKKGCLNRLSSDDKNLVCGQCRPHSKPDLSPPLKFPNPLALPYGKMRQEPTRYRHDPLGSQVPSHLVLPRVADSPSSPSSMMVHIQPRSSRFTKPVNKSVTTASEKPASQTARSDSPINLSQVYPPSYLGQSPYSSPSFPVDMPGTALASAFGHFALRDKE
jgi:hypothetical protein